MTDIKDIYSKSLHPSVFIYINDYIETVNYKIMENSIINDSAEKIYKNHKQLLDIIIENKPNEEVKFKEFLENKVKECGWILGSTGKGFVRFLTTELNKIIPKKYQ